MNKKNVIWWLGLIVAVLTAIISYCSCTTTAERFTRSQGHTSIITTDTTNIYHGGNLEIKIK